MDDSSGRQSGIAGGWLPLAEAALDDGAALRVFLEMVAAQGGDVRVFDDPDGFHKPGATEIVAAWESGYVAEMDTTALGWAVQRTGAGREKAGEPVDPHAGILFHARRGAKVEKGQPLATIYATNAGDAGRAGGDLERARFDSPKRRPTQCPLVGRVFTRENAENYLRNAVR